MSKDHLVALIELLQGVDQISGLVDHPVIHFQYDISCATAARLKMAYSVGLLADWSEGCSVRERERQPHDNRLRSRAPSHCSCHMLCDVEAAMKQRRQACGARFLLGAAGIDNEMQNCTAKQHACWLHV